MSTRREILLAYADAAKSLELAEAAINILEKLSGATPLRCIKQLQHYQQRALRRLDDNAAKLGAPYPGSLKP